MASPWSVADCIKELQDLAQLLQHRKKSQANSAQFEMDMVKAAIHKIKSLQGLTPSDCLQIYQCIDGTSFVDETKDYIRSTIDQVLLQQGQSSSPQAETKHPQAINIMPYLTLQEWDLIQNCSESKERKMEVIAARLRMLGVSSLAPNPTVRSGVVAILSALSSLPSHKTMYEWTQELKLQFASSTTPVNPAIPYRVTYPQDPKDLGTDVLKACYGNEQPACKHPSNVATLWKECPLRNTDKRVKGPQQEAPIVPAGPAAQQEQFANLSPQFALDALRFLVQGAQGAAQPHISLNTPQQRRAHLPLPAHGPAPSQPHSLVALNQLQPKLRGTHPNNMVPANPWQGSSQPCVGTLPLQDQAHAIPPTSHAMPPQANQEDEDEEQDYDEGAMEAEEEGQQPADKKADQQQKSIEEQAFAALKDRMGTGMGSGRGRGKGRGKGRGRGKGKSVQSPQKTITKTKATGKGKEKKTGKGKEKTTGKGNAKYDPGFPSKEEMKKPKKNFASKHYHQAKKAATKMGKWSEEECLDYARAAHQQANQNWDKMFE